MTQPSERDVRQIAASESIWALFLRIVRIIPGDLRRLTLSSQFERRTTTDAFTEPVHPRIERPELYRDEKGEIYPPRPEMGRTGEHRFAVRGTVELGTCDWCSGKLGKRCNACGGSGKTGCLTCGGSGTVRTGSRGSRKDCPRCRQGKRACGACNGRAYTPCRRCEDHLKIRTYTCVDVAWTVTRRHAIDNPLELPDTDLDALVDAGIELDLADPSGRALRSVVDEVPEHALLFQTLHAVSIAVIRVDATLFGRPLSLWLLGEERRLIAPELVHWSRVLDRRLVLGTAVLLVGGVLCALLGRR